ncbi:MAG TPA: ATP-binding protein [Sphingobacteriaceae bacterium]|nr:ATP-binding protein [Sphingobacteriaceae bacterium]
MRKPLLIFYFLTLYALAELIWWGVLLIRAVPHSKGMILGEGAVFIFLFIVGAYQLHKAINKDHKLHKQQKNFLLSVTHELKSPLASIKLYIETILKRDLSNDQREAFLVNSLKDIERLDDLVENMLLATKIDNKSYSFPKEEFNLSKLVEKVADRLQVHSCKSQTINLSVKPEIYLKGDKFALTSVVTNLVENAVKYSYDCAEVDVHLEKNADEIILSVADNGIGIADEEKPRIFDKFYRVGNEDTRKTKGTGLGLYIVKHVLDKHQATIKVRNNQPSGSIFEVIFNGYGN